MADVPASAAREDKEPPLRVLVESALEERLLDHGFARHGGRPVAVLSDGVLGMVGVGSVTYPGRRGYEATLVMTPHAAVRHLVVEKVVADLRGEKFQRYGGFTVSRPLAWLAGRRHNWDFTFDSITDVADDLAATVLEFGLPFMRQAADLSWTVDYLESDFDHNVSAWYAAPVAAALLGDYDRSRRLIERSLSLLTPRRAADPTDSLLVYAARALTYIEQSAGSTN